MERPLPTQFFEPPAAPDGNNPPANRFSGVLEVYSMPGHGRIDVLADWFEYAEQDELQLARLPDMRFELVQDGRALIPLQRVPRPGAHPHWEMTLGPGAVWDPPGSGGWSRASLPFALMERNENCTHNGLITFMFRGDGAVTRAVYQVGSETCQYFQADLWGTLDTRYEPGDPPGADAAVRRYRDELRHRLPLRPLAALAEAHPGARPENLDWYPAGEVSTAGFVVDGVHYSAGCPTRHGPYPFCESLVLPSYSLAKSVFGGLAWMLLEQAYPGIGQALVTDYIPECNDPRWTGVTLEHLLDMTSGNYSSLEHEADEYASYESDFMAGETHALKVGTACSLFPRQAEPGSAFAYHTSDTYLAGTLMSNWLRRHRADGQAPGPDLHRDVLDQELLTPLQLSPLTAFTRRSYDDLGQPFTGYGLAFHPDDIARLAWFLSRTDGELNGRQALDRRLLNAALQRDPADRGIATPLPNIRYNNGFWALGSDLGGVCAEPAWIPFMSGYGGISVAIFPNRTAFYVFSDNGRFEWHAAAVESNRIRSFCN